MAMSPAKTSGPLRPLWSRKKLAPPEPELPPAPVIASHGEQFDLNTDDPRLIAPPEPLPEDVPVPDFRFEPAPVARSVSQGAAFAADVSARPSVAMEPQREAKVPACGLARLLAVLRLAPLDP